MGLRLAGKVLAAAEADLQPDLAGQALKRGQRRQPGLQQRLLPGRERPALQPPERAKGANLAAAPLSVRVVRRPGHAFSRSLRPSIRSVFSQEKPPSAVGVRPKWP